jgi:hypothetical protein
VVCQMSCIVSSHEIKNSNSLASITVNTLKIRGYILSWLEGKLYFLWYINLWILCYNPNIYTKCIWWQIFVEFLISWLDTIHDIWHTTNYHKFMYQRKYNFPSNQDNMYPRIFNVFTVIDASELNNYKSK